MLAHMPVTWRPLPYVPPDFVTHEGGAVLHTDSHALSFLFDDLIRNLYDGVKDMLSPAYTATNGERDCPPIPAHHVQFGTFYSSFGCEGGHRLRSNIAFTNCMRQAFVTGGAAQHFEESFNGNTFLAYGAGDATYWDHGDGPEYQIAFSLAHTHGAYISMSWRFVPRHLHSDDVEITDDKHGHTFIVSGLTTETHPHSLLVSTYPDAMRQHYIDIGLWHFVEHSYPE